MSHMNACCLPRFDAAHALFGLDIEVNDLVAVMSIPITIFGSTYQIRFAHKVRHVVEEFHVGLIVAVIHHT
jgi:hypothetical protein